MSATNYKGEVSKQSKSRKKKARPSLLWKGLASFAANALKKSREAKEKALANLKKE